MTLTRGQTYTGTTIITNGSGTFGAGLTLSNATGPALYVGTNGTVVIQGNGAFLRTRATNQLGTNVTVRFDMPSGNGYFALMGNNQSIGNLEMGTNPAEAVIENTEGETGFGNSLLTVFQTTNATFSGYFRNGGSGTIGLIKEGTGNLTLSGNRMDYTGGTTVNAGTLMLGGNTPGRGAIRGTVTVNQGATLDYSSIHSFGWDSGASVNVLNINGGTVGGANIGNHFWGGGTFTLNMNGGELKLGGGGDNPTQTMNFNVLSNNTTARVTAVSAGSALSLDGTATFTVADGSQDVDLLISANMNSRNNNPGQVIKRGTGTMRMTGTNSYTVGTWVQDGVLEITNSSALGAGAIAVEGGTLRYLGTGTDVSSRVVYGNVTNNTYDIVNTNANLTFNSSGGTQGDSGARWFKLGAGQLTLGNVNLKGGAEVRAGTLQLGSSAGSGNAGGNISISNAATLKYYTAAGGWIALGNTISGPGTLIFEGTGSSGVGDFGVSQNNTNFSGSTFINTSRVWLTHGNGLGTGAVTVGNGASLAVVDVTITNALNLTGNGWLESSGNLGALRLSGSTGVVAGPVTLAADSRIGVWNGSEGRISGVMRGTNVTLEKAFEGVLWLTGTNNFSGTYLHNSGATALNSTNGPALFNGTNGTLIIGNNRGNNGAGTATWRGQFYSVVEIYRTNQLGTNVDVRLNPTAGNAYFAIRGNDTVIGNLSGSNNTAAAVVENTEGENSIGPGRLTVTQTTNATYSGYFRNGGTGTLALTKII